MLMNTVITVSIQVASNYCAKASINMPSLRIYACSCSAMPTALYHSCCMTIILLHDNYIHAWELVMQPTTVVHSMSSSGYMSTHIGTVNGATVITD